MKNKGDGYATTAGQDKGSSRNTSGGNDKGGGAPGQSKGTRNKPCKPQMGAQGQAGAGSKGK